MSSRWSPVPEEEALALAGTPAQQWLNPPVTYVLGKAAMVVVLDAGDRPHGSGVQTADEVTVRPPIPETVAAVLAAPPETRPAILGFVRVPHGCVPLGELSVTLRRYLNVPGSSQQRFEECRLAIRNRLPLPVLDRVRPVSTRDLPDLAWLDLLPDDPIGALRAFVTGWFGDIPPVAHADTNPASAGGLPDALANLYAVAAGRSEPLGGFNAIFTPDNFEPLSDGRVIFGAECQAVWRLLMDPTEADPAVVYDSLGHGPVVERERLARFLVQFSICDAAIGSPHGGFARTDRTGADLLVARLRPIPLQPLHWPTDPTRLYVGSGVAVAVCPAHQPSTTDEEPETYEIYVGSRHRLALQPLREPGFEWEYFTG